MKRMMLAGLLIPAAVAALLIDRARRAQACGPFFYPPVFTAMTHPDFPLGPYTRGQLGVLQSRYDRIYLYVAYRNLAGPGFSRAEALDLWGLSPENARLLDENPPPDNGPAPPVQAQKDWPHDWVDARNKVPGAPHLDYLQAWNSLQGIYRERQGPNGSYSSFVNCLPQAFESAIGTLRERAGKLGGASTEMVGWVTAQDQVFSNCEKGENIPEPLPAGASKPAREDRRYQIAAAYFYAGDFEKAAASFREIASDPDSPWDRIAKYLVARTWIREATVGHDDDSPDPAILARAEDQLKAVLADPRLAEFHASASRLFQYTEVRLRSDQTVIQLSRDLMQKQAAEGLGLKAHDYTFLLDKLENARFGEDSRQFIADRRNAFSGLAELRRRDDLTDWVVTFQDDEPAALDHAYQKWRETRSAAWLVAAISKVQAGDSRTQELINAARAVQSGAPAYACVSFHRLRLMMQAGDRTSALNEVNQVLDHSGQLPVSARNLFLAVRMSFAQDLGEFLKDAQRVPLELSFNGYPETGSSPKHPAPESPWFDSDAVVILNKRMPISVLTKVAESGSLPDYLRRQVAIGAWTRAFLLNEDQAAVELAGVLRLLAPQLRPELASFIDAPAADSRQFAGVFMILRSPGLRPYVTSPERGAPLNRIDNLRENWWDSGAPCGMQFYPGQAGNLTGATGESVKWPALNRPLREIYSSGEPAAPAFLSAEELSIAEREWKRTQALASAPDYLGAEAVRWVRQHPSDSRAAEAMALVVRAGHLGCGSKETWKLSEQAFEILHRRYASTSWARQTKYWYR